MLLILTLGVLLKHKTQPLITNKLVASYIINLSNATLVRKVCVSVHFLCVCLCVGCCQRKCPYSGHLTPGSILLLSFLSGKGTFCIKSA